MVTAVKASGGLVGYLYSGSIDQSFASGDIDTKYGGGYEGGLVGTFTNYYATSISVSNSYASGSVAGYWVIGGLIGTTSRPNKVVVSSYSLGAIDGSSDLTASGGFAGKYKNTQATYDYWNIDTSGTNQGCGQGKCSGITGLTDVQLKSALPAGFDSNTWGQNATINNGYPYLLANPPPQ